MSRQITVNAGETSILDSYIAIANIGGGFRLKLFTNDVTAGLTPAQVDALTAAAFTEATFPGYAAITFNSGWVTTAGNPSSSKNTARTFTRSTTGTAQQIRGWYLIDVGGGVLQRFEQFDAPVSLATAGDAIVITPQITLDDSEGNMDSVGSIKLWPTTTAETGWLLCDGAAVSRTTFANLFALIGTQYGAGDGSLTFNVPDLRQRFALGKAASGVGSTLGASGGAIDHVHNLDVPNTGARIRFVTGDVGIRADEKAIASWTSDHDASAGLTAGSPASGLTSGAGLSGDTGVANPPFLALNYVIKA